MGLHGDMRKDIQDKRRKSKIILGQTADQTKKIKPKDGIKPGKNNQASKDSRFTTRLDMAKAVTQVLNSPAGQLALSKFDTTASPREEASCKLNPKINDVERLIKKGQVLERGLVAAEAFVLIDRLPGDKIHLQTAYPSVVEYSSALVPVG